MTARADHPLCAGGCERQAWPGHRFCGRTFCLSAHRTVGAKPANDPPGQLGLLDTPPPPPAGLGATTLPRARRTDRETSHAATRAAARGLNAKQRAVLACFREWGAMHHELLVKLWRERRTEQLARGFGAILPDMTDSSLRTRVSELTTMRPPLLRDSGRETRTERGGRATIWELTPEGASTPTTH